MKDRGSESHLRLLKGSPSLHVYLQCCSTAIIPVKRVIKQTNGFPFLLISSRAQQKNNNNMFSVNPRLHTREDVESKFIQEALINRQPHTPTVPDYVNIINFESSQLSPLLNSIIGPVMKFPRKNLIFIFRIKFSFHHSSRQHTYFT
jgi:hypothetical protein